ncbi:serine/threonine-protein kinase [Microbulbifer sp.]|uniref:serine/threonine-protein kinase n=1 Tax=Microbulbifer sp. TaxID=1908541 RepID=UPI00258EBCBD|nr:serine/threonine-protein kinase [Microbulbifer sp.]
MNPQQSPFHIGRYLVTGKLGAGGMGVVYLASDEHLNRQVAIKKLHANPNSSNAHQRIRQEARLLAQLNHNNIVQIYDVVEDGADIALVMEYVDGCSLDRWQREREPNLRQKLQLLKQICEGLTRAHSAGIIHRDLKAENVLVDSSNTIKITDFGIAKNWLEDSQITREQHVAGSWGAMSPEQAQGKPLDNRSDLFAFGVLAYRLLCGQNPFGDGSSPYTVIDRIVNNPHPPAIKLNPDLPQALCDLLDRLLAKNPDQRPFNAAAVAAEIEHLLQDERHSTDSFTRTESVTATVESYYHRQHHKRRWQKWLVIPSAVVGCLALLATLAYFGFTQMPEHETEGRYIAVVSPDWQPDSDAQRLLKSNVMSALKQGLSTRDGLLLIPFSESRKFAGQSLEQQARALNAQLLLVPQLDCNDTTCELTLDLINANSFAVVASRSTHLAPTESLGSRSRTLYQLNYLLPDYPANDAGDVQPISAQHYQRYLELFEQRDDERHQKEILDALEQLQEKASTFAPLYEFYAAIAFDYKYNSNSTEAGERLAAILQQVPQAIAHTPEVLKAKLRLAIIHNDPIQAEKLLTQLHLTLPDHAAAHYLSAIYYQQRGETGKALEDIDKAIALRPSYIYRVQKAMILSRGGELEAANAVLQEAIAQNHDTVFAISLLAGNLLDGGQPGETIRLLTRAGLDRIGAMDTYNLCLAYYIEQRYTEAQSCFKRVSDLAPKDADPLLYRAEIAREQQQPEQARALAQKALSLTIGRDDWEGLLMQARAYAELDQAEKAVENLIRIRRDAPDDLYVNYARAQVYITTGDLLSAKAHIRKTLELGISPIWYCTAQFAKICNLPAFDDLRQQYPGLCGGTKHNNKADDSQIARNGETSANL